MNDNAWKFAARAWWQRLNEERARNAELLQKIEELRKRARVDTTAMVKNENLVESIKLLESAHIKLKKKLSDTQIEKRRLEAETNGMRRTFLEISENARLERRDLEDMKSQLSNNTGDFAALAERIAFADGKKPRDLEDGGWGSIRDAKRALFDARNTLEENPMWSNALRCEVEEATYDLAAKDFDGLCAELLDVATVAMRWRRAVLERGKK